MVRKCKIKKLTQHDVVWAREVWYPCGCCSRLLWDIVSLWMHDYLMIEVSRGATQCLYCRARASGSL